LDLCLIFRRFLLSLLILFFFHLALMAAAGVELGLKLCGGCGFGELGTGGMMAALAPRF